MAARLAPEPRRERRPRQRQVALDMVGVGGGEPLRLLDALHRRLVGEERGPRLGEVGMRRRAPRGLERARRMARPAADAQQLRVARRAGREAKLGAMRLGRELQRLAACAPSASAARLRSCSSTVRVMARRRFAGSALRFTASISVASASFHLPARACSSKRLDSHPRRARPEPAGALDEAERRALVAAAQRLHDEAAQPQELGLRPLEHGGEIARAPPARRR